MMMVIIVISPVSPEQYSEHTAGVSQNDGDDDDDDDDDLPSQSRTVL